MRRLRALSGWVILALFLGWPPIHMLLVRRYHFSTWRYGGFGMYAAPDASDREVHVFLSSCGRTFASQSPAKEASDRTLGFYYRVEHGRSTPLAPPRLDREEARALARLLKDLRSLARPIDFERLAGWIDKRMSSGHAPASLGILVTEPHIDPSAPIAYAEAFGFVRERGQWSPVTRARGTEAVVAMVTRAGTCR